MLSKQVSQAFWARCRSIIMCCYMLFAYILSANDHLLLLSEIQQYSSGSIWGPSFKQKASIFERLELNLCPIHSYIVLRHPKLGKWPWEHKLLQGKARSRHTQYDFQLLQKGSRCTIWEKKSLKAIQNQCWVSSRRAQNFAGWLLLMLKSINLSADGNRRLLQLDALIFSLYYSILFFIFHFIFSLCQKKIRFLKKKETPWACKIENATGPGPTSC